MYKALYDYSSDDPHALAVHVNERFTVLESSDTHWWLVQNGTGQVGYVPGNYLGKDESDSLAKVLLSIDKSIFAIQDQISKQGGNCTSQQKCNLKKLEKHRLEMIHNMGSSQSNMASEVGHDIKKSQAPPVGQVHHREIKTSTKRRAPPPPLPQASSLATEKEPITDSKTITSHPMNFVDKSIALPIVANHGNLQKEIDHMNTDGHQLSFKEDKRSPTAALNNGRSDKVVSVSDIPDTLYLSIVDSVRSKTSISYDMSKTVVSTVLSELRHHVPSVRTVMDTILRTVYSNQPSPASDLDLSEDGVKLRRHFRELAACKDDSQQRSWFLHEDEATICGHLQGLLEILDNGNPDVCHSAVAENNYEAVHNLVLYYQMEVRVSIRLLLLKVFGALSGLDVKIVSELLNSVLPLELARDMQADTQDVQKLVYSSLVLVMVFSMGEMPPVRHYDHLNADFVQFLFDLVESPPDADTNDQTADLIMQIILAFNLHFELPSENIVMQVLAKQSTANNFMEKLMLLVNREVDPVRILPHEPHPQNSLLKFLSDMYSSSVTAGLMYTNDAKVLIDIVLRHIHDLSPGDKIRTEYLSLFHLILKSSSYGDHCHRRDNLQKCLLRIQDEEQDEVDTSMDKIIVTQIWSDFPQWFPAP